MIQEERDASWASSGLEALRRANVKRPLRLALQGVLLVWLLALFHG